MALLPPGREEEAISLQNSGKHISSQPDLKPGLDGEKEVPPTANRPEEFPGEPSQGREEVVSMKHGGRTLMGVRELQAQRRVSAHSGSYARARWVFGDRSGLSRATPSLMGCRGPGVAQGKGQGWGCHRRFSRAADISVQ